VADQKRTADAANSQAKSWSNGSGGMKSYGSGDGEIGDVIDLVKTYVRQETVGPLKGLGRKVGVGIAGSLLIGMGLFFLALGLLRLIQHKIPRLASGSWSWASYAIVVAFCLIVTYIAITRIKKTERELS
jgi:hypothetical protein